MNEYILCGPEDAVGAVIFVLIVVISIIVNAVKASKEKREREERTRNLNSQRQEGRPSQAASQPQAKPTSIEDFLRELSGAPPAQKEPEPQQRTSGPAEWHAPPEDINVFREQQRREKERELEERESERERGEQARERNREREKREHERKREREKRQQERSRERDQRERERQRQLDERRQAMAAREEKESGQTGQRWRTAARDAYQVDSESVHSDAYRDRSRDARVRINIRALGKADLKRAIILREVLGPPHGLKGPDDISHM